MIVKTPYKGSRWVHALCLTHASAAGVFQWGNGLAVDNTMWYMGEPTSGQDAASMEVGDGGVALSGHHTADSLYFVCQGRPGW